MIFRLLAFGTALLAFCTIASCTISAYGSEVRYFPSIMYGHIVVGTGASRYETGFTASAKKETRVTLKLFNENGEPMQASFLDEAGEIAVTGSSFEFYMAANRTIRIRIELPPDEASLDVAIKTGWATFAASENIEVRALVQVTRPDGSLLSRYVALGEIPPSS